VAELLAEGHSISHAHLRYLRPFPKNLGDILKSFETVIVPEINNGQLIKIIRDVYFVNAIGYNKIMGIPITKTELVEELKKYL
jgi:2-oxoglutarate ferredoxin oxidoreductase subunit alpha